MNINKIKKLSNLEIQKIAAGEVVERPANVVKELVENSIDAQATHVTIYIEDGGKKLIRIVDDGTGISEIDLPMAIEQHATSKISTVEDLIKINTFGFRGEALSSISAVSDFTIESKEISATIGSKIYSYGGSPIEQSLSAIPQGTDIKIKDLFFNVPARKKFLKTKETEFRAIVQLFHAFCFAYPKIYFKLFHENKLIYNCPPADSILKRAEQIDQNLKSYLLPFESADEKLKISCFGAISNPNYQRYDRSNIFLFVNNRWVKNIKLSQAIVRGYQSILQPAKYPAAYLFVSIDSDQIDINIHPRKEEVQFLHPRIVENLIEDAVRKTLDSYCASAISRTNMPKINLDFGRENFEFTKTIVNDAFLDHIKHGSMSYGQNYSHAAHTAAPAIARKSDGWELVEVCSGVPTPQSQEKSIEYSEHSKEDTKPLHTSTSLRSLSMSDFDYKIIGQTLKTYIIVEKEDGLVLIDQHAAHERIIYEKLKNNFDKPEKIKLLFPTIIKLNTTDIDLLMPYFNLFEQVGIEIEKFNPTELIIKETPLFLKNQSVDNVIKEVIGYLNERETLKKDNILDLIKEKIHAQLACAAAIKSGDELSHEKMKELINELYKTDNKLTCPHGRPTIWSLPELEIKKKFKRDYR